MSQRDFGGFMFERRAYMLDVSRDRVPTRETLEWLVALNSSPLFSSLFTTGMPGIGEPDAEAVARGMEALAEATERFSQSIGGPRGAVVAAEMGSVCRLAQLGLRRLGAKHGLEIEDPTTGEIEEAAQAQRAAWLLSSRPGGLDDSISKLLRQR